MVVDMYAKCEYLLDACMVFDKSKRDSISWNALITRLLDCGYISHVGNCIEKMFLEKIHVEWHCQHSKCINVLGYAWLRHPTFFCLFFTCFSRAFEENKENSRVKKASTKH